MPTLPSQFLFYLLNFTKTLLQSDIRNKNYARLCYTNSIINSEKKIVHVPEYIFGNNLADNTISLLLPISLEREDIIGNVIILHN